jgi:putative ABC transport system permease protein
MSVLWRKSLADLTWRKGRTLLLVLGILIGVLGITAVNEATSLIGGVFFYSADASAVPNILFTVNTLPVSVAATIQHLPNVATLQQRTTFDNAPWILAGGAGTASIQINAYPDLQHQQLDAFQLTSGRLPGRGEIVMDVSDQAIQPIMLGGTVTITTLTGQQVAVRVVGLARTKGLAVWHPAAQALAYMSSAEIEQFAPRALSRQTMPGVKGPPTVYGTQLLVKTQNVGTVRQTYNAIAAVLNGAAITTLASQWIYADGFADIRLAVSGLLGVIDLLAWLALVLVGILILNTVTTMLTEQTAIIGIMKAIGGTRWRIIRSYLVSVSLSSLVGTALGVDLGLIVGYQLAASLTATAQQAVGPFQVAPWVLLSGISVGLLAPPLAALLPLWIGTRITVRDALAAYGVRASLRTSSHAWGRQIEWVPQTVWLGLRSLFRRPGRVVMTLLTLTLIGAIFMAVQVTNASLASESYYIHADMRIDLVQGRDDTASSTTAISALLRLPNVARVEPIDPAIVSLAGGELKLLGLPAETQLYQPRVVAGRWLRAHELGALVINNYAAARLHLSVGDTVTAQWAAQQAEQAEFRLVGIVHEGGEVDGSANPQGRQGLAFTTLENLNALRHLPVAARAQPIA